MATQTNNWITTISNEFTNKEIKNKKITVNKQAIESHLMFEEDYLSIKIAMKDKLVDYSKQCKYIKVIEWYNNDGKHDGEIVFKDGKKIKLMFSFLDIKILREIPHYEKYTINKNETSYFFI